jgi:hypothetical protein
MLPARPASINVARDAGSEGGQRFPVHGAWHAEAHTGLSTAIGMVGEMGMTSWLPEAEAELAEAIR